MINEQRTQTNGHSACDGTRRLELDHAVRTNHNPTMTMARSGMDELVARTGRAQEGDMNSLGNCKGQDKGQGQREIVSRTMLAMPRMGHSQRDCQQGKGNQNQVGDGGPQQWKGQGGGKQEPQGEGT